MANDKVNDMAIHRGKHMARAVRRKAPSRVRYEQEHPTVSCRVPREVYDMLQTARDTEGKSFAEILKIGLGIIEVWAKEEGELRNEAHREGYLEGFGDAEQLFKVTYSCSICRGMLEVMSEEEKEAIRNYMQEQGRVHQECPRRSS